MVKYKKRGKIVLSKHKKPKRNLEQGCEISLWMDNYDEIFSGFDPRPYLHRSLSNDFLSETKKASMDKDEEIDLELLIPSNSRSKSKEEVIKKRLKEHFNRHFNLLKKETRKIILEGLSFVILGVLLMVAATLVLFEYGNRTLFLSFLIIFLEPGGWFLFWEGLNLIIFKSQEIRPDLEYYRKMSKCKINFVSY